MPVLSKLSVAAAAGAAAGAAAATGTINIAKGCAGLKESIDANTEYHKEIQQQMAENRKGQAVFNNQLAEGLAAAGIYNNLKAEGEGSEAGIQQQMAGFNNQLAEGLAAAGIDNNLKAEGEGSEAGIQQQMAGAGFDYNHSPPPKKWFQPSPGYNPKRFITLKGFISIFH